MKTSLSAEPRCENAGWVRVHAILLMTADMVILSFGQIERYVVPQLQIW